MTGLVYAAFFIAYAVFHVKSTPLLVTPPVGKIDQKHPQNDPLIVLIDAGNNHENILDVIDKEAYEETDEDLNDPKEDAKYMFYNYLRTSPEDHKDPEIKQQKEFFRTALRKRCDNVLRCKRECESSEEKEEKYCPVNCQDIFDKLNICEPPKKKKDHCDERKKPKCGKTLPPKWRFK